MSARILLSLLLTFICGLQISAQLNWEQTNGPYGGEVYDIKMDSKGNYYAASSGGLYISTDNCENWSRINLQSDYNGVSEIFVHPSGKLIVSGFERLYQSDKDVKNWNWKSFQVNNLYLNSMGILYSRYQKSILTSTDTAKTWKEVYKFKDYARFFCMIDDNNFIASVDSSIYYSSDSGKNWQKSDILFKWDSGFSLDSKKNIYAITNWDLYKSSDYGKNWKMIKDHKTASAANYIYRVFVDKSDGVYIVTQNKFYYSNDGCVTWKEMGNITYPVNKLWQDKNEKLYCLGGMEGISLYNPAEKTMTQKGTGINALYITKLYEWNNELICYANLGTSAEMNYKSTNYGNSWTKTNIPGEMILIDKLNRLFTIENGSIMFTEDNGKSWNEIFAPKYLYADNAIIVLDKNTILFLSGNKELYKTVDLGKTWKIIATFPINMNYGYSGFLMTSANELYLRIANILYKSINSGVTWTKEIEMNVSINSISESRWGTLFLSTANELYKKEINGWEKVKGFPNSHYADQIFYTQKNVMIAIGWLELLISSDYGKTFTIMKDHNYVGYYYSAFSVINDRYIFLAETKRGLFRASILDIKSPPLYTDSILDNYPNPFNNHTNIEFFLEQPGKVNLTIYNSLGEQVEKLVENFVNKGIYKINWLPKNLSSGVYFYRLQTPLFSETKKMILLK